MTIIELMHQVDILNQEYHIIRKKQALLNEDLAFLRKAPQWRMIFGLPDFIFATWMLNRRALKYQAQYHKIAGCFHEIQQAAQAHFEGHYNQQYGDDGYPI